MRALLATACLLGGVGSTTGAAAQAPAAKEETVVQQVARLLRSQREVDAPPEAELAAELARLGEDVLPVAFHVLEQRRVPPLAEEGEQQLSLPQRALLRQAFAQLDRRTVLARHDLYFASRKELGARRASLEVLAAVGRAPQLVQAFALVRPKTGEAPAPELEEAFRGTLAALLARDPATYDELALLWPSAPRDLHPVFLVGLGDARDPRGLDIVVEILARDEALAPLALAQVPLVAPRPPVEPDPTVVERLRRFLEVGEHTVRRAACKALAALDDQSSIPLLIDLFESESEGLRADCLWALRRTSGMAFPADARLWRDWYAAEEEWLLRARPRVLIELTSKDAGRAAAALRVIARHRLGRHESAAAVARLLQSPRPELRRLACEVLGGLGSGAALPALARACSDRRPEVAGAAARAFEGLTGAPPPAETADAELEIALR